MQDLAGELAIAAQPFSAWGIFDTFTGWVFVFEYTLLLSLLQRGPDWFEPVSSRSTVKAHIPNHINTGFARIAGDQHSRSSL